MALNKAYLALKQGGEKFVSKNFTASLIGALACLVTSVALFAGAPVRYVANLHIAPDASAIPVAWITDTDQIRAHIVKDLGLASHYGLTDTLAARELRRSTTVSRSIGSAVGVHVSDRSAAMAAKIAAAYAEGIHRMTVDLDLSNSAAYLREIRHRKAQALRFLQAAEAALVEPRLAKSIARLPAGWIESINASGPILAANALQSKGPYQTNGPSTIALESQRLTVLESIYSWHGAKSKAAALDNDLLDGIRAIQCLAFWKALVAGMNDKEEALRLDIKRETSGAPVELPAEAHPAYPFIPWIAALQALLGLPLLALCIAHVMEGREREPT